MKPLKFTIAATAMALTAAMASAPAAMAAAEFVAQQSVSQWRATNLIGLNVKNTAGETIGDVNDLVVGKNNTVDAVVIGVGGFLGMGEKNVAIKFDTLDITKDNEGNDVIVAKLDKEALESAPAYKIVEGRSLADKMKKKASELGDKAKKAAKEMSESAEKAYEDAKKTMTDKTKTN